MLVIIIVKSKYLPFIIGLISFLIVRLLMSFSDLRDLSIMFEVGFFLIFIFSIPTYFFFKFKPFRLHTKTSMYLFGSSKESTFLFIFSYYLFYAFLILAVVFAVFTEFNKWVELGLSFSAEILIMSLIYAVLSIIFFRIMHHLATKSDDNKLKKSEGAL